MSLRGAPAGVAAVLAAALILPPTLRAQPPRVSGAQAARAAPAARVASAVAGTPAAAPDTAAEDAPPALSQALPDADATLPIPPVPPRIAEGAPYEACLAMLASDPSGADALATGPSGAGMSAEAAAHCHALAQVELGNTEAGAALLDRLAASSTAPAASRAVVFAQAGQAWTMAGRADQAFDSASRALALSPDDPELLIGHAIAATARQMFALADADLSHALDLDPKRADALVLRATARRRLGRLEAAGADIAAAAALDADDPDMLLERGIIRQRTGDLVGARADWERASDLVPDTPTGDLAAQNLALLQAGPPQ